LDEKDDLLSFDDKCSGNILSVIVSFPMTERMKDKITVLEYFLNENVRLIGLVEKIPDK
jgi:hypothetical protein